MVEVEEYLSDIGETKPPHHFRKFGVREHLEKIKNTKVDLGMSTAEESKSSKPSTSGPLDCISVDI